MEGYDSEFAELERESRQQMRRRRWGVSAILAIGAILLIWALVW